MRASLVAGFVLVAACGSPEVVVGDEELGTSASALKLDANQGAAILDVVNYPATTVETLDVAAGLDLRAAKAIIARRDGADGRFFTADDKPFASIAELDAVAYVGDAAFDRLLAYSGAHPAPAAVTVELVTFAGWQAETVLWGANNVPAGTLNGLLDNRAAANVIAARPIASLQKLGAVALIGPNALQAFRGQAKPWWVAMQNAPASLAGTFDGVTFDETTAAAALALANEQTKEAMVAHGLASAPATAIIAARPYATLAAVSAVTGVGAATMQALYRWASAPVGADPVAELQASLQPLTADLWMPSETDASFAFVSATGIGSAPITEALIRQTLAAQHDALLPTVMYVPAGTEALSTRTQVETYDGVEFLNRIIDNADPNDPDSLARAARFATLRDALTSQLTDFKVVRFGRINISVFIIGRTSNGALAGLLTGQVET